MSHSKEVFSLHPITPYELRPKFLPNYGWQVINFESFL